MKKEIYDTVKEMTKFKCFKVPWSDIVYEWTYMRVYTIRVCQREEINGKL